MTNDHARTASIRTDPTVYDLLGIGIGPFNLSLAALCDGAPDLRTLFLDAKPAFSWHPGLLMEGTVLQVPFLADLVTMADPTSPWSYLNYLREHDRMFPFFFSERFHIPRREYDHYCRWVAGRLPSCRFDARVTELDWEEGRARARGCSPSRTARRTVRSRGYGRGRWCSASVRSRSSRNRSAHCSPPPRPRRPGRPRRPRRPCRPCRPRPGRPRRPRRPGHPRTTDSYCTAPTTAPTGHGSPDLTTSLSSAPVSPAPRSCSTFCVSRTATAGAVRSSAGSPVPRLRADGVLQDRP